MPYEIAGIVYKTKDLITKKCQAILHSTTIGSPITGKDKDFLIALFEHHDGWEKKSKGGVKALSVQDALHGTKCFTVKASATTDISFLHAIKLLGNPSNILPKQLDDFRLAARTAIRDQILEFRGSQKRRIFCPIIEQEIDASQGQVDHEPPETFDKLLFNFCERNKVNPLHIDLVSPDGMARVFADKTFAMKWAKYHRKHAKLRVVSKLGNLRLPKTLMPWRDLFGV